MKKRWLLFASIALLLAACAQPGAASVTSTASWDSATWDHASWQ